MSLNSAEFEIEVLYICTFLACLSCQINFSNFYERTCSARPFPLTAAMLGYIKTELSTLKSNEMGRESPKKQYVMA